MNKKVNGREAALLTALRTGLDTSIEYLYGEVFPVKVNDGLTLRRKQQELGSVICSLNQKLKGEGKKIVPGTARRTYIMRATA